MSRTLDFSDGHTSASEPNQGNVTSNKLKSFVDDAAYVADKGSAAADGDIYYNTTSNVQRMYLNGAWQNMVDSTNAQTIGGNKTFSGNVTVSGDLQVDGTTTTLNTTTLDVEDVNITVNNGGNQASADDAAGLTVEMSDATDASIIYDKDAISRFRVGDAGSEIEVADISSSQVITNKDIDGGTASNTNRITLPKNTTTNLDALTRKQGNLFYDTTTNTLKVDDGSDLNEVSGSGGGGSGINYIDNPDAETDTTGWATYADAAGESPVDGTGGAANITFSRNTSSPLRDTADFDIAKDVADRQGEGVSYDFSIDSADTEQTVFISFDYSASANYADGDIGIFIYDVTNTAIIRPSNVDVLAASKKFLSSFNASSSTSYRLIFHIASTNATAYDFNFDNVNVGPDAGIATTSPVGEWEDRSSDFTFNGLGTTTGKKIFARRDGEDVIIRGIVTAGTVDGTIVSIDLPSDLNIKSSRFDSSTALWGVASYAYRVRTGSNVVLSDDATAFVHQTAFYDGSDTASVFVAARVGGNQYQKQAGNVLFASGDSFSFEFKYPVEGWSSESASSAVVHQLPISDDIDITSEITLGNFGTTTNDSFFYKRIGNTVKIRGVFQSGTPVAAVATIQVPSFLALDTSKVTSLANAWGIGRAIRLKTSTAAKFVDDSNDGIHQIYYDSSSTTTFEFAESGGSSGHVATNANALVSANDVYYIEMEYPVEGWSSNLIRSLPLQDEVEVTVGNGHGSTNTKIRRFTNIKTNKGSAITYADSSADGGSFTINENGLYSISYSDDSSVAYYAGLSVNSNQLTTNINDAGFTDSHQLDFGQSDANTQYKVGGVYSFNKGDVVRAHTNGSPNNSTDKRVRFRIIRIG